MQIRSLQVSAQGLDRLSLLKRHTGITKNNVLCRWAFCVSLKTPKKPNIEALDYDSGGKGEIAWETFAGGYGSVYLSLLKQRCIDDGIEISPEALKQQLTQHVHRGLGYLVGNRQIQSIEGLIELATDPSNELANQS